MSSLKTAGLAALTAFLFSCKSLPPASLKTKSLAECLADQGVVLYGTSWCGACERQKEAFGDAISLIPYVDCDEENLEKCRNIIAYPSWRLGNGRILRGYKRLDVLAKEAGCEY